MVDHFSEQFVFSLERERELKKLLPGSEDYYYFNILHLLSTDNDRSKEDDVLSLLNDFKKNHKSDSITKLESRVHVFYYEQQDKNKQKTTLNWIAKHIGVEFDHKQSSIDSSQTNEDQSFPSKLDQHLIDWNFLFSQQLSQKRYNFEQLAYPLILKENKLPSNKKKEILSNLEYPDIPDLPQLVADYLEDTHCSGFGSLNIHQKMTKLQLDQLLELKPDLINSSSFVSVYINKLQPSDDVDIWTDSHEREEYLERLLSSVQRWSHVFNEYKATVLYHILLHYHEQGKYSSNHLMSYLQIPKRNKYVRSTFLKQATLNKETIVESLCGMGILPGASQEDDKTLVEKYLAHFFLEANDFDTYLPYCKYNFLKVLFAETKLVSAKGDPQEYIKLLRTEKSRVKKQQKQQPSLVPMKEEKESYGKGDKKRKEVSYKDKERSPIYSYQDRDEKSSYGGYTSYIKPQKQHKKPEERIKILTDRVEIEFPQTNPKHFLPNTPVILEVDIKNVKTLLVKVFEINLMNYYKDKQVPVTTDIDLDGLVAHEEKVYTYDENPIHIVRRKFEFSSLNNKRGIFVIEFIGGGKSSRCIVRKGHLRFVDRLNVTGHVFRIFDEECNPVEKGALWINGKIYQCDEHTKIVVPYAPNQNYNQTVLLIDEKDNFVSLHKFCHQSEAYVLDTGIYVDRESLLPGNTANVIVRANLCVNNVVAPLSLLEEIVLELRTKDLEDVESVRLIKDLKLKEGGESIYPFEVPNNLQSLNIKLSGKVKVVSTGSDVHLSQTSSFTLNTIDIKSEINDIFLRQDTNGYYLLICDKTGEPLKNKVALVSLKSKFVTDPVQVTLATNQQGFIDLGTLKDVECIRVGEREWGLLKNYHSMPSVLHSKFGEDIQVALTNVDTLDHSWVALFETRNNNCVRDCWDLMSFENNLLTIKNLDPGSYLLILKQAAAGTLDPRQSTARPVSIKVAHGKSRSNFVFGKKRILEQHKHIKPLQITSISDGSEDLVVVVANTTPNTRVHVLSSQLVPQYDITTALGRVVVPEPHTLGSAANTTATNYISGRSLSAEYIYILERRLAEIHPGNNLRKPTLLLNPWAVQSTSSSTQQASHGDDYRKHVGDHMDVSSLRIAQEASSYFGTCQSNLDFLRHSSSSILNLHPDPKSGIVKIPKSALGHGTQLRLIALDEEEFVTMAIPVPQDQRILHTRDLTLSTDRGLDPQGHFTEQKHISEIQPEQVFRVEDTTSSKFNIYDTIGKVFDLYKMTKNNYLNDFMFILDWETMTQQEKLTKFSEYACHELNFFIYKKDKVFFNGIVKPFLVHKKEKTFMDDWLLGKDMSRFVLPYLFDQLNILEKIILAERLPSYKEKILRNIQDMREIVAPNPSKFNQLFTIAMKESEAVSSLGGDDLLNGRSQPFPFNSRHQPSRVTRPPVPHSYIDIIDDDLQDECEEDDEDGDLQEECKEEDEYEPSESSSSTPKQKSPRPSRKCEEEDEFEDEGMRMEMFDDCDIDMPMLEESRPQLQQQRQQPRNIVKTTPSVDKLADEDSSSYESDVEYGGPVGFGGMRAPPSAYSSKPQYQYKSKAPKSFDRDLVGHRNQMKDRTQEFAEHNYYHIPNTQSSKDLVKMNHFWADYAGRHPGQRFVSKFFVYATRTFTEMMFSLAVLDLPLKFVAPHVVLREAESLTITAKSGMIVFHKVIKTSKVDAHDILVSQNFFDPVDRFSHEKGEKVEKYIKEEFLSQKIYGCKVVLTNVSSIRKRVDVLLQIPVGAIPVNSGFFTKSRFIDIFPYTTTNPPLEYYFYFPKPGTFDQFPVHVAEDETVVAHALPNKFHVVAAFTKHDTKSWAFLSQMAPNEDLLRFLQTENISNVNLSWIAWRMKDLKFFELTLKVLRERMVYEPTLWSYGLYHNNVDAIFQYLQFSNFSQQVGPYLSSPILNTYPTEMTSSLYEHLEYGPIINARSHQLGGNIANDRFKAHYNKFLSLLCFSQKFGNAELMAIVYYLLLQDRITEAKSQFSRISFAGDDIEVTKEEDKKKETPKEETPKEESTLMRLQYDYLRAFLDFYNSDPSIARAVAVQYANIQVPHWRKMFQEIADQLNEIGILEVIEQDTDKPSGVDVLEPELDFEIEGKHIVINYENVKECLVRYYKMDIELLFSSSPFVQQNLGNFSYIMPNISAVIPLPPDSELHKIDLPSECQNTNVMIEISANKVQRVKPHFSHSLFVKVLHEQGIVKVCSKTTGQPLTKSYIKVFARLTDGLNAFYKDGYTDLRGKFDYFSLSTDASSFIDCFSILVMSEKFGTTIVEAFPPNKAKPASLSVKTKPKKKKECKK